MKKIPLLLIFSAFFVVIPNLLFSQCLTLQSTTPANYPVCGTSANQFDLWNDPAFLDTLHNLANLAEFTVSDLVIQFDEPCGSAVVKYRLGLDLDQDGIRETVITSENQLSGGRLLFNNHTNPGFGSDDTLSFDNRPVVAADKYRFVLQDSLQGTLRTVRLRWSTVSMPGIFADPQLPMGKHLLEWEVQKDADILTQVSILDVKDCKAPTIVCINGLSVNLMPTQQVDLWASDFLQYTEDNTTPSNLILIGVRRVGEQGSGFPTNPDGSPRTRANFTCTDIGPNSMELWTKDASSNTDYCITSVTVNDAFGTCAIPLDMVFGASEDCGDSSFLSVVLVDPTTPPYTYLWNTGDTTSTIWQPETGTYWVTVTDNLGNMAADFYDVITAPSNCAFVQGHVRIDADLNCVAEPGEQGFRQFAIRLTDDQNNVRYVMSDGAGYFSDQLPAGNYTAEPLPPNDLWSVCQPASIFTVAPTETYTFDVPVQAEGSCPEMHVQLTFPLLRRCFESGGTISFSNFGNQPALDAYLVLELDPFLALQSAGAPYTSLGNNRYRFDLGDVPVLGQEVIHLNVMVSCESALGQTHCSEATIHPHNCAPPDPAWTGASLQITADCQTDSLRFLLQNIGIAPMSIPLQYVVLEDIVMLRDDEAPSLGAGQSMVVALPATGATWRIEAQQEPLHPGKSMPALSVEGCGTPASLGILTQYPADDADLWVDKECRQNIGSYDPNDKQGFPIGYGATHYILPGTDLEYLIRFQNTGTDTAFTVVVRDTLSTWLNPETIEMGAASHENTWRLTGPGIIEWRFENILLPDSTTNLAGSNGFVAFRISMRDSTPLETDILNSAGIYFDFNEPVITNTTQHRVGINFVTVGAWTPVRPVYGVTIAPHPLQNRSWLQLQGAPDNRDYHLRIYDVNGKLLWENTASTPRFELQRNGLPSGLCFFEIRMDGALAGSGKLIVE